MKKLRLFPVFFTLFSVLLLTSCTTDSLDSDLTNQEVDDNGGSNGGGGNNGGGNNGGNNGGGNNGGGNTTGSYWPMAVNNKWTYDVSTGASQDMKIINTQTIDNKLYYKYDNFFGTSTAGQAGMAEVGTRQQNGVYYAWVKTTASGTNLSPVEYIMLKDNIGVGETWNQTLVQNVTFDMPGIPPITMTIEVQGKIIEKNITLQVGTQTFNDVIHTKLTQSTLGTSTVTDYYFAKSVGPIKIVMTGGGVNQTQTISSYVVN